VHSGQFDGAGIQKLIGLIYDSVSDSGRWTEFMAAFGQAVGAPFSALLIAPRDEPDYSVVRWHGWRDDDVELYLNRYAQTDPLRLVTYQSPEGTVAADYDICPRDRFESSVVFREFFAPRRLVHSMGGVILTTPTGQSVITTHRGDDAGPFGEKEIAILRCLIPHLKRAALLHGELGLLRRQLATFTGHLERFPYAFLLVDAKRRVLYSSAAARGLAAKRDGLTLDQGIIAAASQKSQASLDKAVMELATGGNSSIRRLEIPRTSGRRSYRLILMPINRSRTIPLGVAVPAVSILVIDAHSSARPDPDVLRELFSFTPAEARVSTGLVMGQSAEEIALATKTSVETVRTHIKRIFSKTSTARQGELISSILRTVPFQSSENHIPNLGDD
jgi:DNA-binding CsgD family transcriptional regulator